MLPSIPYTTDLCSFALLCHKRMTRPCIVWLALLLLLRPASTLSWLAAAGAVKSAPSSNVPLNVKLLVLPGFFNDAADYMLEQAPEGSLVQSLQTRGWNIETQIRVLPVKRTEWLNVFLRGATDLAFWQGKAAPTNPAFRWYLTRVQEQIAELCHGDESARVVCICHSAGGWLARASIDAKTIGTDKVCGIVTLGAPHFPPPAQVMDMTRGALKWTSETYPGAYHNELFYITVVGDAVQGVQQNKTSPFEKSTVTGFAYNSYEAVCGDGTTVGDGVVPVCAAHLEGATQINLPGIFHSINVPSKWYGSDAVIDSWHGEMIKCIQQKTTRPPNPLENIFSR